MNSYLNHENLTEVCRTCLKMAKRKNGLFEVETQTQKKIVEMLKIITKFHIDVSDELPQNVCHKCTSSIKNAFNFVKQTEQNQQILLNILNTKQEIEFDEENKKKELKERNKEIILDEKNDNNFESKEFKEECFNEDDMNDFDETELIETSISAECNIIASNSTETNFETNISDKTQDFDSKTSSQIENNIVELFDPVSKQTLNISKEKLLSNTTTHVQKQKNNQIIISILDPRFDYDENGDYLCTLCQTSFKYRKLLFRHKKKHEKQARKAEKQRLKELQKKRMKQKKSSDDDEDNSKQFENLDQGEIFMDEQPIVDNLLTKTQIFVKKEMIADILTEDNDKNNEQNTNPDNDTEDKDLDNLFVPIIRRKCVRVNKIDATTTCDVCHKVLSTVHQLKKHKKIHDSNRQRYKCEICNKDFSDDSYLRKHKKHYHDANYQAPPNKIKKIKSRQLCMLCGEYVVSLHKHMITHTKARPHKCDVCPKSFRNTTMLKDHKRTHTGERPFSCEICGKSFHKRDLLRNHEKTHGGEKKNKCSYCDKAFFYPKELTYHIRRHTQEKPFECGNCEKAFVLKHELTKHCKVRNHNPKPITSTPVLTNLT